MSAASTDRPARRWALAALWALALVALGAFAAARLQASGDLRLFMPEPRTAEQRLLMHELGEGPGARLLLVALAGAPPEVLAERSRALRARLEADPAFAFVGNGDDGLEDIPEALAAYRYVLGAPRADGAALPGQPLDAAGLRAALASRLADLGSPAGMLVAPLLPTDPTLETLRVLEAWTPAHAPRLVEGTWASADGAMALLLVGTAAAGFDPPGQAAALQALRDAHAAVLAAEAEAAAGAGEAAPSGTLEASGPGAFSVLMAGRTRAEASALGGAATLGLVALLALAYRGLALPLLGALPLASAAVVGLAATALAFGEVHGITLAFGFTLIGVAQDYPVHLFSHLRPGEAPAGAVRRIWPTLATGVASTGVAYLTFFVTGVPGLQQLAVFTIAGLGAAALATRFALPHVLGPRTRDVADAAWPARLQRLLARLPRLRGLAPALAVAALAVIALAPTPWWEDDLGRLTPVPVELLQRDRALRAELGAPDVRWMLVQEAADAEAALAAGEALAPRLQALVDDGAIAGFDLAARTLPSAATQAARQAALPAPDALAAALAEAQVGTPFRAGAFDGFLADVERARTQPPLRPADLAGTPLGLRLDALLLERDGRTLALVSLTGVERPEALAALAAEVPGLALLDLKAVAESLAGAWRGQVLWALGLALVLLSATVWIGLREARRGLRVLAPMALGTLLVLAALHGAGVSLTLFHLVALVLAAGLGLDYALFFEHAAHARERAGGDAAAALADERRTLHALLVCTASTLLVFALLGLSSIPVLRAIGLTVGLGVVAHFALALLLLRPRAAASMPAPEARP